MSILRLFATILIFGAVTLAWMVLGGTMWVRTEALDSSLSEEMSSLWGPEVLVQTPPYWSPATKRENAETLADRRRYFLANQVKPSASRITANIEHEYRYKGLLWYSTFTVAFSGEFTIPAGRAGRGNAEGRFVFNLPDGITSHDGLGVTVDGQPVAIPIRQKETGRLSIPLTRETEHSVLVAYSTYGQNVWLYAPAEVSEDRYKDDDDVISTSGTMTELKDFSLTITTNFRDVDYPKGTRSPKSTANSKNGGMATSWRYDSLVTNQAMGIVMPKRDNAGPVVARMSFFAPVSLLFFLSVVFTVAVRKNIPFHPMHYLFVSAGFFAFHILLAYLADQIAIQPAFWICAAVSVFLVVSYMRLVAGVKFALVYAGIAQLVYLVGFSYAFFWVGKTGLTVTIGAIVTLFVLMQTTGKIDWSNVFKRRSSPAVVPPPI